MPKKELTWDLSPLLKGDNDPTIESKKKEAESQMRKFVLKWKNRKDYLENPTVLKEALDEYEFFKRNFGHGGSLFYYFYLRTFQDQADPSIKSKFNKATDFIKKLSNELRFFELDLAKISPEKQKEFLNSGLFKDYKHFLERIFASSKYLLSEKEENILSLKGKVAHDNWEDMVQDFLAREEREILNESGKKVKKSFAEIQSLMSNTDKKVRDSAAEAFNEILEKLENVAEAEMNSLMENKKINDELRGFSRPDARRHLSDDIDSKVVDSLVKSVSSRFDVPQRYYKLKAALFGVKVLKYHERNVPYGKLDKNYSYEDSVKLVKKVFGSLDKEFLEVFEGFVSKNLLDVFPNKGKKGGAYCFHSAIIQPTYILLNHADRLQDVLTLAHEVGHGINNEFMKKKQNSLNFGVPKATAEVASTFMEDFVLEEIKKNLDGSFKLDLLMYKLNDDISTIFRQVACYMFEQELHKAFREKGYLSSEEIGKMFQKHMSAYMGKGIEQSEGSQRWWVYWTHLRDFFYTYSYSSGLLISKVLQEKVKKDPKFILKVKDFLAAGTSKSPKDIFLELGIDISDSGFWNNGLKEIGSQLDEAEKLAKKLGKLKK